MDNQISNNSFKRVSVSLCSFAVALSTVSPVVAHPTLTHAVLPNETVSHLSEDSSEGVTLTTCQGSKIYTSAATYSRFSGFLQIVKCEPGMMGAEPVILITGEDKKLFDQVTRLVANDFVKIKNPKVSNLSPDTKRSIVLCFTNYFEANKIDQSIIAALTNKDDLDYTLLGTAVTIYGFQTGKKFGAYNAGAGSGQPHLIVVPTAYGALDILGLPTYFPIGSVQLDQSAAGIQGLLNLIVAHEFGHNPLDNDVSNVVSENRAEARAFLMAEHHPDLFGPHKNILALEAADVVNTVLQNYNFHKYLSLRRNTAGQILNEWPTKSGPRNTDDIVRSNLTLMRKIIFNRVADYVSCQPREASHDCVQRKMETDPWLTAQIIDEQNNNQSYARALADNGQGSEEVKMIGDLANKFPLAVNILIGLRRPASGISTHKPAL